MQVGGAAAPTSQTRHAGGAFGRGTLRPSASPFSPRRGGSMSTTEQTTAAAAGTVITRRRRATQTQADARLGILLVAPAVITIAVIAFYPLGWAIWNSLHTIS